MTLKHAIGGLEAAAILAGASLLAVPSLRAQSGADRPATPLRTRLEALHQLPGYAPTMLA